MRISIEHATYDGIWTVWEVDDEGVALDDGYVGKIDDEWFTTDELAGKLAEIGLADAELI